MAKTRTPSVTPKKSPASAGGFPKNTPDTTNKTVDVSRLLELSKEVAGLESETDILKEEIKNLQDQIDIDNPELDKLDKRKSEYKTLKNKIVLAVELIKIKRDELSKKNSLLRRAKLSINEIANVSASKNIPKEATPEEVERITEKTKQIENQKRIK